MAPGLSHVKDGRMGFYSGGAGAPPPGGAGRMRVLPSAGSIDWPACRIKSRGTPADNGSDAGITRRVMKLLDDFNERNRQ